MSHSGNRKILQAKRRKPGSWQPQQIPQNLYVKDVESSEDFQKSPKRTKFTHSTPIHTPNKTDKSISKCQANARLKRLRQSLEMSKQDSELDESSDTPHRNYKKLKTSTPLQERLMKKKTLLNLTTECLNESGNNTIIDLPLNCEHKETTLTKEETTGFLIKSELNNNKSLNVNLDVEVQPESSKSFINETQISLSYLSFIYLSTLSDFQNDFTNDKEDDMDVEMEWTPQECVNVSVAQEGSAVPPNISELTNINEEESKLSKSNTYVVVDTNIFIENLQTITNILHISYEDDESPVIFVPWMVIQELDYFKDGYSVSEKNPVSKDLQRTARRAVKFINECLISRRNNFKGQSVRDAADDKLKHLGPDDSILSCCFQVADQHKVILLSGDTNLRNKAIINNILAYPPDKIISVLKGNGVVKQKNINKKVFAAMSLLCSFIIYSENSGSKDMKNMPWDYKKCMKYMKINFGTLLKPFVQKQCRKVIDDIHEVLFSDDGVLDEKNFVNLNLSMLIYMKTGFKKYEKNILKTQQEIQDLEKLI